jgi:hypothetical protein
VTQVKEAKLVTPRKMLKAALVSLEFISEIFSSHLLAL